MNSLDLSNIAFSNLWRTKLRTSLTVLGVVIGIGALTSMVSFGVGMEKNMTDAFKKNDLFTSLNVTSKNINLEDISSANAGNIEEKLRKPALILNDSVVAEIYKIPSVAVAFPEIRIPVKLRYGKKEISLIVIGIPMEMKDFYPFNEISYGSFFSSDSAFEILIRENTLKDLGYKIKNKTSDPVSDSLKYIRIDSDSLINSKIEVVSKNIDMNGIHANPFLTAFGSGNLPISDTVIPFVIKGIITDYDDFGFDRFRGGIFIPFKVCGKIPNLGFNNVWELFGNSSKGKNYSSIYVRVKNVKETKAVIDTLKQKGLNVFAFTEELKQIKRAFLIMDSLLGAIGLIALVVAALGIINTMLMSILERTREIGIMKSIGGSEGEIKMIFFVEASVIGLIGAVFGLGLGWIVTRIANAIMNSQLRPQDLSDIELFSFPWWLIVFSVVLSLAAGLYPAIRAARIDPVKALRHD